MALKSSNLFRSHLFYGFLLRREKSRVMAKPLKFKGVDEELQKILDANMDEAPARRRAREAFKHIQLGLDHILFKTPLDGLKMKEIADDMVPPWILKQILIGVANILPKQKLVPQKDLAEAAFRDIKKRELTPYNVIAYKDKPRLRTALEMLRTTGEIEQNLEKVSLPILILHGENDIVTDPAVSKALYEKASSSDKNIIIYKDAGHSLLEGEPDDMINRSR
ncbi:caffeoylshikimate esterase isoform X2 [Gossypium australe]|uniref:Caffeoylshikimate esterase isoform X2 n=1 Tax=Gossypium australe TaxID=47621 RepID=A0A5B6USH8_9ROSI|nr:caffeoylshikimate esterase isoform X2 [Gossypium australe]